MENNLILEAKKGWIYLENSTMGMFIEMKYIKVYVR